MNEPVCKIPVRLNKYGIVLQCVINPVAAVLDADMEMVTRSMRGMIAYAKLSSFWDIVDARGKVYSPCLECSL